MSVVSVVTHNQDGSITTTETSSVYAPGAGLAIGGAIGGIFLLPYVIVGTLVVGAYYVFKK